MKITGFPALVVSVVVALVVFGAVIPIFADTTQASDTYTNEGYFRMSHYDATTDHTLTWTYEEPNVVTVDNVKVPIDYNVASGQTSIVIDTNFIVRYFTDSAGVVSGVSYLAGVSGTKVATVANNETATFTFTSGTMAADVGSYTGLTNTYTDIYLPTLDGPFTMKKADIDAYMNGDSEIVAYGTTRINSSTGLIGAPGVGLAFNGSIDDGATGFVWRNSDVATLSNIKVNGTEVSSHIDLYMFDSITATATYTETVDDETVTTDTLVTYNYVLVPYEVTAERAVHPDATLTAILDMLPFIIGAGLVVGAVAWFITRKG